jgi:hypothetical protein
LPILVLLVQQLPDDADVRLDVPEQGHDSRHVPVLDRRLDGLIVVGRAFNRKCPKRPRLRAGLSVSAW